MHDMLKKIVAQKKKEIKTIPLLESEPEKSSRDFYQAVARSSVINTGLSIIAEIKPKSPSEGVIVKKYDAEFIAQEYERAGVNAISVLTDHEYFGGSFENLKLARAAVDLPLLCKEFIIHEKQIAYARACGADACLLIASILSQEELINLKKLIEFYNMTALIEIFDQSELEGVLKSNPKIIGINNRNLNNFSMNTQNSNVLSQHIPDDVCVISASGIQKPEEVINLDKKIDGILIGTALMQSNNKIGFIKSMREHFSAVRSS